ncbi:PREDICTED: transmembrane protein 131-like, partial [Priapulus caudatus]|uniref:Transmembrane protein 131-like n=1 Tax=Priapulus caudatus TaxID=37621 RepID=A0ABM1FBI1_PRICU
MRRNLIMAGAEGHQQPKMYLDFLNVVFTCCVINLITTSLKGVEAHSQAFIQTDTELRYMVDGISVHIHEGLSSQGLGLDWTEENMGFASPIRFEPPMIDFGEHPVGMPHLERVLVQNPSSENSVTLYSISGSTVHFQCSFFEDKVLSPGGNTTFDIVFLARQEGNVENTLHIHTSVGHFKYQVFGVGIPNPYKLRPFLGAKIPLNSSYATILSLHNPHNA